jgi:ribose transport system substrate-binding protein
MKCKKFNILGAFMILAMVLTACQSAAATTAPSAPAAAAPAATTAPAAADTTAPAAAAPAATTAPAASDSSAKKITVGLVQIDLSNPFHIGEVEGAKEAARRYGFNLEVTSGEGDVNKQVAAFENLINKKVDVIAANFIDIKAFGPALQKAKAANIPVVCLHSSTDSCAMMLGFDERSTGQSVGEYAVKLLTAKNGSPKGEVANLQGLLGQGLNEDRTGGFMDVMAKYSDIKVDAKDPTNWDPKKAADITETWLTAYPKLDLIYGNSDSLTVPAANVIQNASKGDQIIMVSIDGTDSGLKAVKDGLMKSTFLYDAQYTGFYKAWIPFRIAQGEKFDQKYLIKGVLVTTDNVDSIMKFTADQNAKIQDFQFEKPLTDLVSPYLNK